MTIANNTMNAFAAGAVSALAAVIAWKWLRHTDKARIDALHAEYRRLVELGFKHEDAMSFIRSVGK
jgi:hypothetical protein